MAKILLISPPYLPNYMRNARCDYVSISNANYYPMWLSYAGALLESKGHEVCIIDAPAEGLRHEKTLERARDFGPQIAAVYSSTRSQQNDITFAESLKHQTGCRLIFVGPFVSIDPVGLLRQSQAIDGAIVREFDYPLAELADGWPNEKVLNLYFRDHSEIHLNEIRPILNTAQLDAIPFVTKFYKKHLNLRRYKVPQQHFPFVDLVTGRGCHWGRCTFCLWVHTFVPGPVYQLRSLKNVIEEFRFVQEEMSDVREIFVQDDMLTNERAEELAQGLIDDHLQVTWTCYAKANLNEAVLKLMKRSGCRLIHVGYESLDPIVLKNIKKGATIEQYNSFTSNALKAGLEIHGDFLMGGPGETRQSMENTLTWAKNSGITTAQFEIINTYPTLPLHTNLKNDGCLEEDEPNYKHLTRDEIRSFAKQAFAEFYFRPRYFKKLLLEPRTYLFPKLGAIATLLKFIFLVRWRMGGGWNKLQPKS